MPGLFKPRVVTGEIMRTGVIQPLPGIGDMIWLLPALRAIAEAAPDGKITLFTRATAQAPSLFRNEPWVERVVALPVNKRGFLSFVTNMLTIRRALREAMPDRLYVLHHSPRYVQAAKLSGVKEVLGYTPAVKKIIDTGWARSLAFLQEIGVAVADPYSRLSVAEETRRAVADRFAGLARPWLVLAPGASNPERCWSPENFAAVADRLVERTGGTVFLIGAKSEADSIGRVEFLCKAAASVQAMVGQPLEEAMALMSLSDGLLGNDSGPANVAAALGRPAYALCGITQPARHSPLLHLILPQGEAAMAAITPDQVIAKMLG